MVWGWFTVGGMKNQPTRKHWEARRFRKHGMTWAEIGSKLGVSACVAKAMARKAEHDLKCRDAWNYGLDVRICNILCNMDINSAEEAGAAVFNGRLDPHRKASGWGIHIPRHYGVRSHIRLCNWLRKKGLLPTKLVA